MQKLVAMWNSVRGVWEKPEATSLLCEHSEPYLETWPTSGTMLNGQVYEQPTPVLPTIDTEFLSSPGQLLRTPTAAEVDGGPVHPDVAKAKGQTLRLTSQVLNLLPTPNTQEGSGKCRDYRADLTHALTCDCKDFGEFTPAIERWEKITGRLAPAPTLPDGQKGQERLSSKFTEWMMGLPDGWITGHGLHRKDAIKMAGNGVVPQQAKLALEILREGL